MIKLKKWMTNPCEECTHVLSDETGEAVIVDCGVYYPNERRHLLEYIEAEHLHPVRLLLTHAHHDHVYGNELIHEHFGLLPEIHESDKQLMTEQLRERIDEIYPTLQMRQQFIVKFCCQNRHFPMFSPFLSVLFG